MSRSVDNPWLNRFAWLTALATLALVGIGGLVTSHGAGMAVPDWPTTYGYNMFFFPVSGWVGGIFYEHTHRLAASAVGLMTVALAAWLWVKESRAFVRWLGIAAVFAVVLQGVLGGLRVALHLDQLGIFHAALAQSFLVLICLIALFTSRWWISLCERISAAKDIGGLRKLLPAVTALIFVQLLLGATMRHQHAGLSIPDFPLAYGKLWPAMAPASVTSYNQRRLEVEALNPITATQIVLQMAHRIMALLILIAVGICAWSAWKRLGCANPITRLAVFWVVLILAQAALGAFTIWSNKAADVATAHVLVGAVSLVTGALLTTVAFRVLIPVRAAVAVETPARRVVAGQPAAASAK